MLFLNHAFLDTSIVTRAIKSFIVLTGQVDLPWAHHRTYNTSRVRGIAGFHRAGVIVIVSVKLAAIDCSIVIALIPYHARLAGAVVPPDP
jgi:hypothetical protein